MSRVSEERASTLERSRAFNVVVNLRTDLVAMESRLAGLKAQGRHCRQEALKLARDHVATLRADLASAESYCREINPDQLAAHDEAERRKAAAERQAHEIALAEKEATLEANRQANAVLAEERLQDRARQKAIQDDLAAEAKAEAERNRHEDEARMARNRHIAEQRLAHREAALTRRAL